MIWNVHTISGDKYRAEVTFGDMSRANIAPDALTSGDPLSMMRVVFQTLRRQGDIVDVSLDEFLDTIPADGVALEDEPDPTPPG